MTKQSTLLTIFALASFTSLAAFIRPAHFHQAYNRTNKPVQITFNIIVGPDRTVTLDAKSAKRINLGPYCIRKIAVQYKDKCITKTIPKNKICLNFHIDILKKRKQLQLKIIELREQKPNFSY